MSEQSDTRTTEDTLLRSRGIQLRMRCKSQVATRIENIFVTVERLVDAIESDTPLTEHQGVGPATADVITHWWENRFEREEQIDNSSVKYLGGKPRGFPV